MGTFKQNNKSYTKTARTSTSKEYICVYIFDFEIFSINNNITDLTFRTKQ